MMGGGTGSDVMRGMVTALLSLFVIPAIYMIWKRHT